MKEMIKHMENKTCGKTNLSEVVLTLAFLLWSAAAFLSFPFGWC